MKFNLESSQADRIGFDQWIEQQIEFDQDLGGYDPETRVRAFRELLPLIEFARLRGLDRKSVV